MIATNTDCCRRLPIQNLGVWSTLTDQMPKSVGNRYTNKSVNVESASQCDHADKDDVLASLEGDPKAYEKLVLRHQELIGRYMWRFTRSQADREMLTQDVFVEAYYSLGTFKGTGSFTSWLKTIATRTGYKYWKQKKRHSHQPLPEDSSLDIFAVEPDDIEPKEAAELIQSLLAQLPPRDRLILTLMYLEQQSTRQIAENTSWSLSMVKVQAHRARKKLKKLIENHGGLR